MKFLAMLGNQSKTTIPALLLGMGMGGCSLFNHAPPPPPPVVNTEPPPAPVLPKPTEIGRSVV